MGDFYLFLASDDSSDFYPLNTPGHFSIKLPETMHMDGSWMCALRDLQCKTTNPTDLLLFCDAIDDSYIRERKLPVLQRIPSTLDSRAVRSFDSSVCFRVTRHAMNVITVYITDGGLKETSFTEEPTYCTLHFFRKRDVEAAF